MRQLNETKIENRYDARISCKYHTQEIINTTLDHARKIAFNNARAHNVDVKLQIRLAGGGNFRTFELYYPNGWVETYRTGERAKYIIKSRS